MPSNGDPRRFSDSAGDLTPFGKAELALYDSLGPKARRWIADTPIDIDVRQMLVAFRNRHAHDLFDQATEMTLPLAAPKADDLLARFLYGAIQGRVPAGWRPIEHRPTARGARSARLGLGGARRRWPTTRIRPASSQ